MDTQGWKQRWGTGIGDAESLTVAIGEYLKAADKDAKFGEFDAEDPTRLVETMAGTLTRMSAACATPLQDLIKGQPPSGEALKTAESSLVDRGTNFHSVNTPEAARMYRMGWRLGDLYGDDAPAFDPDAEIKVSWSPVGTRSEKEEAEIAEADLRMGVSKRTILIKRGYDPDEEEKQREEESKAAADAMAKAFKEGGIDDEGGPPKPTPKPEPEP